MQYRERMHVTWQELMDMPFSVFQTDIEMLQIEQKVIQSKQDTYAKPKP